MGLQGKRWPKWKPRRDNSSQDLTDENRKKKLHHGVKCIRKVGWFSTPSRIFFARAPGCPGVVSRAHSLSSRANPSAHLTPSLSSPCERRL
jgi:hypothetical protein